MMQRCVLRLIIWLRRVQSSIWLADARKNRHFAAMEWQDHGTIISTRKMGETSVLLEVFTRDHGRHSGVVRGGVSRKMTPHLQAGTLVSVKWKARLEGHLGSFVFEPIKSRSHILSDSLALAALNSTTSLLRHFLPEREVSRDIYHQSEVLFDQMGADPSWLMKYLNWEFLLLQELGYGLDLSSCAVMGSPDDLIYISPKTGRAVSRHGAGEWAERLLPLPQCLLGQSSFNIEEFLSGLRVCGHFFSKISEEVSGREMPLSRQRFIDRVARIERATLT